VDNDPEWLLNLARAHPSRHNFCFAAADGADLKDSLQQGLTDPHVADVGVIDLVDVFGEDTAAQDRATIRYC
jgi:hypothetical protein